MTTTPPQAPDVSGALLAEYLRTTREMITSQRDVMLAFIGQRPAVPAPASAPAWQPAYPTADLVPAMVVPALEAETAAVPAPVSPAPAPGPLLDVQGAVLSVISDRTGYPVELIELDLDLEADLSVDSIKRAEVAGEVADRLGLSVDGDESELEDLVKARTVRAMVEWLDTRIGGAPTSAQAAVSAAAAGLTAGPAAGSTVGSAAGSTVGSAAGLTASPAALDVQGAVLSVISDRTGYPVELIELDLDLEADLSVDSIKRAEVAGEVANRLGLSVDGDESELEELVKARTVRSMVEWLDARINGAPAAAAPDFTEPAPASGAGIAPQRLVPTWRAADTNGTRPDLTGTRFLITGPAPAAEALATLMAEAGASLASDAPGTFPLADAASGSLADAVGSSPAGVGAGVLFAQDADGVSLDGVDGVVLLDGLDDAGAPLLPGAFPFLKAALTGGVRWLVAAGRPGPRTDGMRGLFRTIAREFPQVTARYLEVGDDAGVAPLILSELDETTTAPVVTAGPGGRFRDDLEPRGLGVLADGGAGPAGDGASETRALGLDADSVIVLVGGARGITPWFARALASAARCRIELVGRTPLPESPADPDLAGLDKAGLRAALARRGMRSPAEIERTASALLAAAEVEATLTELGDLGAAVRYHAVDVRDAEATRQLLAKIHDEHGRIDGLVYAAGIIEDKLIADKDPDSFSRVYRTKVEGAATVLGAVQDPGFVVLFGSIAAAYGNRGQSDYAAANDALDSLGSRWADRTGGRVLTVHWGPWAPGAGHGGMVTPELMQEYARRGIALIDPEEGALSLLRELAWGDPRVTSVVYTASGW